MSASGAAPIRNGLVPKNLMLRGTVLRASSILLPRHVANREVENRKVVNTRRTPQTITMSQSPVSRVTERNIQQSKWWITAVAVSWLAIRLA